MLVLNKSKAIEVALMETQNFQQVDGNELPSVRTDMEGHTHLMSQTTA